MDSKYSIHDKYKYKARPDEYFLEVILKEYGLESLNPIPNELQLTGSVKDKQREEAKLKLSQCICNESSRVRKNLDEIPFNATVAIDKYVSVMRVPNGVIYIFNTYDHTIEGTLIHKSTQFVKL